MGFEEPTTVAEDLATAVAEATTIAEAVDDLLEASTEGATALAERVGDIASNVARALGGLLGGGGAPKPVKDVIEHVADVVGNLVQALGTLLGGDGGPAPADGGQLGEMVAALAGRVGTMANELAHTLGELMGGGGGSLDPVPTAVTIGGAAQVPAFLYERATGLVEGVGQQVAGLTQEAAGSLQVGGTAHDERTGGSPVSPPVAPIPVVPASSGGGGPAPLAGYSSFFGVSGTGADAFQLLFAVVELFALALLQGGKLFWYNRDFLRPSSALVAAIERPG
jgi:hypothetical protein